MKPFWHGRTERRDNFDIMESLTRMKTRKKEAKKKEIIRANNVDVLLELEGAGGVYEAPKGIHVAIP